MNVYKNIVYSSALCTLLFFPPIGIQAAGISFGPMVWYASWDPFFHDDLRYTYNAQVYPLNRHIRNRFSITSAFLYGPVLSIDFLDRWAISGVYMTSDRYRGKRSDANFDCQRAVDAIANSYFTVDKSDLDASVSCRITGWLKIFAGFKWQHYYFRERIYIARRGRSGDFDTDFGNSNGYGAGLGLGAAIPIIENLHVLVNTSGLYLRTRVRIRSEQIRVETMGPPEPRLYLEKERFNIYGGNINTSIAYFISAITTTITLGFRYQFLRYYADLITNELYADFTPENLLLSQMIYKISRKSGYNHTWDHFYGVTLSVVYTLEIAGSKGGGR